MRGVGPLAVEALEADRPVGEGARVVADDHHLVADRLDDPGVVGERVGDGVDEALDVRERLLLARLLGEARVAGEVGEGDRDAHAAEVLVLRQLDLHVADHVLLDEVLQEALVDVVHDRRGQRQQVAREVLHLLGHLQPGHAVAHQRLVHVDVEQAHLGVGDLRERLPVDAHELEEGDEREARVEHRRDVAQRLGVLVGQVVQLARSGSRRSTRSARQRGLEAGLVGDVVDAERAARRRGTGPRAGRTRACRRPPPRGSP